MTDITIEPVHWRTYQKILFRFFALFFVLYILTNPNGVLPFTDYLQNIYLKPLYQFVPWLAAHVLHLDKPIVIAITGSGDTSYDYVMMLLIFITALAGTVVWSVTGRNTSNYNKLLYWTTVVVRYYVGITMISYGFYKVIQLQFPAPNFARLLEPIGKLSPMGLAWTYMGYSRGFNYFTGFAEILTGVLLFHRKTGTLGALVGFVVAGNIMAINYFFDVPVKLLSTTLVVMCMFLLFKDLNRLINFFLKNKEALPANLSSHRFKAKWKNATLTVIKYTLIAYTLWFGLIDAMAREKRVGAKAPKPPLYGLYDVEVFIRNKDTLAPLITDTTRWRRFMISKPGIAQVEMMNDSIINYNFKPDIKQQTATANNLADTAKKYKLSYSLTKQGYLILKGKWKQDSIEVWMKRLDPNGFPLLQRGFHFVNESAYNK